MSRMFSSSSTNCWIGAQRFDVKDRKVANVTDQARRTVACRPGFFHWTSFVNSFCREGTKEASEEMDRLRTISSLSSFCTIALMSTAYKRAINNVMLMLSICSTVERWLTSCTVPSLGNPFWADQQNTMSAKDCCIPVKKLSTCLE